jgi:hypothetical protein
MPSTINSDNGSVSGSAGLKSTADSSGVLALQTNGTTAVTINTSQNVGIGTASPAQKLNVIGNLGVGTTGVSIGASREIYIDCPAASTGALDFSVNGTLTGYLSSNTSSTNLYTYGASPVLLFGTNNTERMRIDTSGNLLVNTTTAQTGAKLSVTGGISGTITSATAVASTSGTSIDFTGIPAWVKRITVMFSGVSSSGTSVQQVQLGDSGGIENSGYTGVVGTRGGETFYTAGFLVNRGNTASSTASGSLVLTLVSGNIWVGTGVNAANATDAPSFFGGTKTLSDTLDRVRITTVNGTDTFDAGSINILYEG